jgi:NADPH-dependent glutamate synthase beta subunit-like oxidoreductase
MEKKVQEIVRRGFDSTIESLIGQLELVAMDIIKGRVHFDNVPGVEAFHDTRAYELLVASKLTQAISLLELVSNEDCRGLFE